ncbi:MAG: hypothetical protein CML07_04470 [Psychrobacter sp.]|nr:hypothetical protein [Psychrobacter sp.]
MVESEARDHWVSSTRIVEGQSTCARERSDKLRRPTEIPKMIVRDGFDCDTDAVNGSGNGEQRLGHDYRRCHGSGVQSVSAVF